MKKKLYQFILLICSIALAHNEAFAQAPQGFVYQAEIRNDKGRILSNTDITLDIRILIQDDPAVCVWQRTYYETTDKYGLVSVIVEDGENSDPTKPFNGIDWGGEIHYLYVEVDGIPLSNEPVLIMSVPYALHANTATTVENANDADADPMNEIQSLSILDNTLSISGANSILLPAGNIKIWSGYSPTHLTATATWMIYRPNVENFNTLGEYITYDNGAFTVIKTGFYRINFKTLSYTATGRTMSKLTVENGSGSNIIDYSYTYNLQTHNTLSMDLVWLFSAGDIFKIELYSSSTGYSLYSGNENNRIEIMFLGNSD